MTGVEVSAFDLSGLGANSHQRDSSIGLETHGQDLLQHLFYNDISDAIVVGHSYGGCVLSQALALDHARQGRGP